MLVSFILRFIGWFAWLAAKCLHVCVSFTLLFGSLRCSLRVVLVRVLGLIVVCLFVG